MFATCTGRPVNGARSFSFSFSLASCVKKTRKRKIEPSNQFDVKVVSSFALLEEKKNKIFFFFSLVRSAQCAKTQTTTAVSMLVCIRVFVLFFFALCEKKKKRGINAETHHSSGLHHQDLFLPRSTAM
jgi:hypothetical protein